MKVSSLEITPCLISIVPWLVGATNKIIRRVITGVSDIQERTPLTERILGGIVCVIPYPERRTLEVILLVSGSHVGPCLLIFEVI